MKDAKDKSWTFWGIAWVVIFVVGIVMHLLMEKAAEVREAEYRLLDLEIQYQME